MPNKDIISGTARETALRALVRFEKDRAYLNLILPSVVNSLPPEEKALTVKLASGTIQHLNTIDWALNLYSNTKTEKMTPWIRNLLRLGAFQLLYLDRIPAYAAINESVCLAGRYGHKGVAGLTNALLRKISREADSLPWPDPESDQAAFFSLRHSIPLWLTKKMLIRFEPDQVENWCRAVNEKPALSIRPNLLRIKPDELIGRLAGEGVKAVHSPVVPGMLRLPQGGFSPAATKTFREGLYTVQGESSALVAPLLALSCSDTVVDLCSAPGGKTTHLAELMRNEGTVFAVELHRTRLDLVEKAARRLGLKNIIPLNTDGRLIGSCNLKPPQAVLVDAPCSGLGVIARLPEIKWRRSGEDLPEIQKQQLQLLTAAADILPSGGKLLYSVCTTEPEETTMVVDLFNNSRINFTAKPVVPLLPPALQLDQDNNITATIWPHRHGLDGFFIALWQKR
ncbi:MAG: 16S rRNA (cytosine(967)-C(5))-methyltransferase RsmB [Bacillota bacterium]|nr:16S rRNA (cytosine(967)-C(5))-methyltransferase RsmB [Bacillota bacterium]